MHHTLYNSICNSVFLLFTALYLYWLCLSSYLTPPSLLQIAGALLFFITQADRLALINGTCISWSGRCSNECRWDEARWPSPIALALLIVCPHISRISAVCLRAAVCNQYVVSWLCIYQMLSIAFPATLLNGDDVTHRLAILSVGMQCVNNATRTVSDLLLLAGSCVSRSTK